MERCKNCDRPVMTVPDVLAVMRPPPGQPAYWRRFAWPDDRCPMPAWLAFDDRTGFRAQMMEQIRDACALHTVDWRQRALDADAEIARLREAIARLPEVKHAGDCTTHVTSLRREYGCDCGADTANAARAEARKLAGLEP